MASCLSLPTRKLQATLQFLQEEHLVKFETVYNLTGGGLQATKFWYIDFNHAVRTIWLQLHLLRKQLKQAEVRARSSSFYFCPGYKMDYMQGELSRNMIGATIVSRNI
jgi:transcription initiation factor IIE alpha subunit